MLCWRHQFRADKARGAQVDDRQPDRRGQEIFFQSFDRLLPEESNEAGDVYEWTANGTRGAANDPAAAWL